MEISKKIVLKSEFSVLRDFLLFKSYHIPILNLLNFFHGNFSPGSIFLRGAISECPKKFSSFILNLFLSFLHK